MVLTFVFDCVLFQTRAYNSLFQQHVIDTFRNFFLIAPCWFSGDHSNNLNCIGSFFNNIIIHIGLGLCSYLLLGSDLERYQLMEIIIFLFVVLVLCYGVQLFGRIKPMVLTILVVWLIMRYFDNHNIYYKMDMLTLYFIVWQFIYLMCKWEVLELKWPSLILQQGSCCISTSIVAFLFNDMIFVYFPFQIKIGFLWFFTLCDV